MTIPVTRMLSEWAAGLEFEDIPARTVTCATEQVVGIIAAIYASSRTDICRPLYSALAAWGDREESTVVGAGLKSSMRHAGMANAFAAQTLEWEDYLQAQHSGASTVPTALAVAEAVGASGMEFLTALIIGNEVSGRTGKAYIHSRLFTNSCPNHQIDTALTAGKLLGLDAEAMMDAVGISCFPPMTQSFAGWFSPSKGMITGAPAYTGISAASLAAHGFRGFHQIIEHPDGFSNAVFERYDLEEMVKDLGSDWRTDTHSPKVYPCCGWLDADISGFFDNIPHAELMKRVARRVTDGRMLHLIKMWLKSPIEETDEKGRKRYTGGKKSKRGTPQGGVISQLLANIYMHRYIKAFKRHGLDRKYGAVLVSYADDFVFLCRRGAEEVLEITKQWMQAIGLELNLDKTAVRNAQDEHFDFLGYTFGPVYYEPTGVMYLGATPSKKAVKRFRRHIREVLRPGNMDPWEEVAVKLNRRLVGWANYFSYGTISKTRRGVDFYVQDRVRHFLRRRMKIDGRGTAKIPEERVRVFGELEVLSVRKLPRKSYAHAL